MIGQSAANRLFCLRPMEFIESRPSFEELVLTRSGVGMSCRRSTLFLFLSPYLVSNKYKLQKHIRFTSRWKEILALNTYLLHNI